MIIITIDYSMSSYDSEAYWSSDFVKKTGLSQDAKNICMGIRMIASALQKGENIDIMPPSPLPHYEVYLRNAHGSYAEEVIKKSNAVNVELFNKIIDLINKNISAWIQNRNFEMIIEYCNKLDALVMGVQMEEEIV